MALWGHGDLEAAQPQLERAAHLLETIRREAARGPQDYKMQLYNLQTASHQVGSVKAIQCSHPLCRFSSFQSISLD